MFAVGLRLADGGEPLPGPQLGFGISLDSTFFLPGSEKWFLRRGCQVLKARSAFYYSVKAALIMSLWRARESRKS